MGKRLWLGLVLCGLWGARAEAATVSFMVIETGLPPEAGTSAHSGLWESGLMDVFFEAGHIVSNAPVLRLDRKPEEAFPAAARPELSEAIEGGAEFFILAMLDYDAPAAANIQKPRRISLRLFKTSPHTLLHEQQYTDTESAGGPDIEYDRLKRAARTLIPHLNGR
jgi:hypothetical protein